MITGTVKVSELGKKNFPGTVKNSWAIKDNLPEAYVASRKAELERAKRSKAKFTKQVTRIEGELAQAQDGL